MTRAFSIALCGCGFAALPPADGEAPAAADAGPPLDARVPPAPAAAGAPCRIGSGCESGRCALDCAGAGTCVPAACETDGDCALPEGGPVACCGAGGACEAIEGGACGERAGAPGAGCAAGGDSDCAEGLLCVGRCQAGAACAAPCEDAGEPCGAPGPGLACLDSDRGLACQVHPDRARACARDADCPQGAVCAWDYSWDGRSLVPACGPPAGAGAVGADCDGGAECAFPICWPGPAGDACTGVCATDDDCACDAVGRGCDRDQVCLPIVIGVEGGPSGEFSLCYPAARCRDDGDCPDGACAIAPGFAGELPALCAPASPNPGGDEAGERCREDAECRSGRCLAGSCADPIAAGEPCGCDPAADGWDCARRCASGACLDGACAAPCAGDAACRAIDPSWRCASLDWPLDPADPGTGTAPVSLCRPAPGAGGER